MLLILFCITLLCPGVTAAETPVLKMRSIIQAAVDKYCPFVGTENRKSCVAGFTPNSFSNKSVSDTDNLLDDIIGQSYDPYTATLLMPAVVLTAGTETFVSNLGNTYVVPNEVILTKAHAYGDFRVYASWADDAQVFADKFINFDSSGDHTDQTCQCLYWACGYGTSDYAAKLADTFIPQFGEETAFGDAVALNVPYTLQLKNSDPASIVFDDYLYQAFDALNESPSYAADPDIYNLFYDSWGSSVLTDVAVGATYEYTVGYRPCLTCSGASSFGDCIISDLPATMRTKYATVSSDTLGYYTPRRKILDEIYRGSIEDTSNLQAWIDSIQDIPVLLWQISTVNWSDVHPNPEVQESLRQLSADKKAAQQNTRKELLQPPVDKAQNNPFVYGGIKTYVKNSMDQYQVGGAYLKNLADCIPSGRDCMLFDEVTHDCPYALKIQSESNASIIQEVYWSTVNGTQSSKLTSEKMNSTMINWLCYDAMYKRQDWAYISVIASEFETPYTKIGCSQATQNQYEASGEISITQSASICTGGKRWITFPTTDENAVECIVY